MEPRYRNVVCYNCGEPGHYVGNCIKERICFMCGVAGHHMNNCGLWSKPIPMAQYIGSANSGLGFFHVNVVDKAACQWLNLNNCGVIMVTHGSISLQELETKMCEAWDANWPWQVRQLEEKKYLVRFPPHKKVMDLVDIPSINLKEGNDLERVTVKIIAWGGDISDVGELKECWVQIRGIPPKWVSWDVIAQISKTLGLLMDVDWGRIFKSFYEVVRVQLAVKDSKKNPEERVYVMKKKFYWLTFDVEDESAVVESNNNDDDNNNPDGDEHGNGNEQEGFDGLEDMNEGLNDDPHTPGVQFGSIPPPQPDKRYGAKSCPVNIQVADNRFQPLMDFGLLDEEDLIEEDVEVMDVVTAGLNETSIAELEYENRNEGIRENGELVGNSCYEPKEMVEASSVQNSQEGRATKGRESVPESNQTYACVDVEPTPAEANLIIKKTRQKKWGPVMPVRQSERITRDGKTVLDKATTLLEIKNLEKPAGGVEKDCQGTQEMDASVQGQVEGDNRELERRAGEEGLGTSPSKLVLKKRRITWEMIGPETPEACGEYKWRF
uniref:Uncharacterized protein n=1 Tax=Avena sativa TaxID=4498 RepID=A0ACD5XFK3_AVESA